MRDALARLVLGEALAEAEARDVFTAILEGKAEAAQIGALLALIQRRGATVDELVGAARAMRERVTRVPIDPTELNGALVDTCGTGGAPKTFNVSTAAALVAAAARGARRVYIAKHGNRSRTGRGSAEVLAALGVNVDADPAVQARCLREVGACFCFAIHHHPAMRHAAAPRKALGFPTIFNLLGPLTNPAGARRQVIGVYDEAHVGLVAEALARLDCDAALVVHGCDGLDEITIAADTIAARVEGANVQRLRLTPAELGLAQTSLDKCNAETVEEAAEMIRLVLAGQAGPARDLALANAAAALLVGGAVESLQQGVALARDAIDTGAARDTLDALARASASQRLRSKDAAGFGG